MYSYMGIDISGIALWILIVAIVLALFIYGMAWMVTPPTGSDGK